MQKILKKQGLNNFLKSLMKKNILIAPIKDKVTKFEIITKDNFNKIWFERITDVPLKKTFIPDGEVLFEFNNSKINEKIIAKKTIIFGLRKCDIAALNILDNVMKDTQYLEKRKNTILIGLFCENPDNYCFCNSMEIDASGYDLFFYPHKNDYHISIGSKRGEKIVKQLPNAKKEIILTQKNYKKLKNKDIEKNYKNKIWESDAEKCLSCSACTVYCPTCNCFDINDKLNIDLKSGKRTRKPASCMLKSFSTVAGGKAFRDSRLSRFKHFVYHKVVYYKKHFNKYMCVGCGRCLRVCPTKIDWVETINLLRDEINGNVENK